jgi:hypothetical protein
VNRGLDYWGPLGCMILILITIVFIPAIGAWAAIPLTAIALFATVMAIVRRKNETGSKH